MSSIPGNTTTTATISIGQTIANEITHAGDTDWYKASFKSGLDYGFRLTGDGGANSLTSPDLFIRDSNGVSLHEAITWSGTNVSISFTVTTTDTYFVDVRGSVGNYRLSWLGNDTIARNATTTATLTQGKTVKSAIDVKDDSDWFKVSLKTGLDYGFRLTGDGGADSLTSPDIFIRDSDGVILHEAVTWSGTNVSISFTVAATDTYFVDVRGSVGNYTLSWLGNDTIARNTATTATLGKGKTVKSAIDVKDDSDWFKVNLKTGLDYGFRLTGDGSADSLASPDIYVRDSDGVILHEAVTWSGTNVSLSFTAAATGAHFIDVRGSVGNYELSWIGDDTVVNNAGTTAKIVEGRSVTGRIDVADDSDWYAVSVKKGDTYQFSLSGTGSDAVSGVHLYLRDADGNAVYNGYNSSGPATFEWTAKKSGKMFLDANGYSDATGKYKLSVVSSAALLKGTAGSDTLTGGGTATKIFGYGGNDTLNGGGGNDILVGGAGKDKLKGGSGNDTASYEDAKKGVVASLASPSKNTNDAKGDSYSSIENLTGSKYNDSLTGNDKANKLTGGAGKDKLQGGKGADKLYGGADADTFVFTSKSDSTVKASGRDTIYDFSRKQGDKIHLKAIDANTKKGNDQKFKFIEDDAFHKKAGELRYEKKGGKTYLYGDTDGNGKEDFAILFNAKIDFVASDFIL